MSHHDHHGHDHHGHDGHDGHEHEEVDPALAAQVAEVLLEGVLPGADGEDPMEDSFDRLMALEAVTLLMDDETDDVELDVSPLMSGMVVLLRRLVSEIATASGSTDAEVVARLRGTLGS